MLRKLLILGLLPAVLLLGAACGGDSDDEGDDPTATAAATEAPGDATAEPTEAATEAPTEEPMDDEPTFLANVDGISCTGDWTNLTFGSTGSFDAVFDINEAGDAGTVAITLGGGVFGAAPDATPIELPITVDGDTVVVNASTERLGAANLVFSSDGTAVEAVFEAPPALGTESSATLEDFSFDGTSLTTTIQIDFGPGTTPATSEINSTCG